ncbi:hypothetical protein N7499_012616 [Penicillium canescens]|uniref:FAD-binding domain-containing protein n=1 Tax=Penicillium canescens TaxID=5083 RepID=A0AAD6I521_PENCN|nr:uncharacterized protein N7446_000741 [Penicillium canescens]KAJ6030198.1 hypothetical protein N7460_010464 [Penicillium canescens]KAJ6063936.1 hypothetical protein N7499_012616 [Penicillium canescens]KAJ6077805.1 hypothetical protein N7446_000741 [Penicillium canescens]KAJ6154568.1 hypothetical protein N7485_012937 [Penicillium canescens]
MPTDQRDFFISVGQWQGRDLGRCSPCHAAVHSTAIAIEDGVALARSLSKIENATEISKALSIFEEVRIQRAGLMQEASSLNGKLWHLAFPRWTTSGSP